MSVDTKSIRILKKRTPKDMKEKQLPEKHKSAANDMMIVSLQYPSI